MILIALVVLLAAAVPFLLKKLQAERHRERLAHQFRSSLRNIVHALRVGVGFNQAIDYAAKEGDEPLLSEWQAVTQAVRIGQPLTQALDGFAQRVNIRETALFVTAVHITQSTGGSLADVLDTLAETLQEQQTLREKISALTAQGKASGVLLAILPYALLGALSVIAPDLAEPLFTTTIGQAVLAGVTVSIVIGGLIIKKIVTIEVE